MSQVKRDILCKIRQGTQRRMEEGQRLRQLKQERREELEEMSDAAVWGASGYITYILISLIFLSFPLSEPTVDWVLVGFFVILNGAWTLCFRSVSWFNCATLVVANLSLVRLSPIIPDLPKILSQVPPSTAATYIGVNVVTFILIYCMYVERRTPWSTSAVREVTKKGKDKTNAMSDQSLEDFARRRDRLDRLDYALSFFIIANMIALVALGAVPLDVLLQSLRQMISFFR